MAVTAAVAASPIPPAPPPKGSEAQVWPLTQIFLFPRCKKKSLSYLVGEMPISSSPTSNSLISVLCVASGTTDKQGHLLRVLR